MATKEFLNPVSALSDECEAVLRASELCSSEIRADGLVEVLTSEGDSCFVVTPTISHVDLRTLVNYGRMSRLVGEQRGRQLLQSQLRVLLGAASAA